jgi:hypothetical protein
MSLAKLALVFLYGSFEAMIGIPGVNIALYSFLLFFSLVELVFACYSFMYALHGIFFVPLIFL